MLTTYNPPSMFFLVKNNSRNQKNPARLSSPPLMIIFPPRIILTPLNSINPIGLDLIVMFFDFMVSSRKVSLKATQKMPGIEKSKLCSTWKITPSPSTKKKNKIQESPKASSSRGKKPLMQMGNFSLLLHLKSEKL